MVVLVTRSCARLIASRVSWRASLIDCNRSVTVGDVETCVGWWTRGMWPMINLKGSLRLTRRCECIVLVVAS